MTEPRYIQETLFDELGFRMSFAAEKIVFQGQGDLQSLVLFENKRFGRMLMLDGATQVTTADEFIYSEMMSHVPILAHGRAKDVLIIGGGDCLIAEEVLKHKGVERCVQVEIDKAVLDFSREYFLEWNRPFFEDKRIDSVIADGMHYVADPANHGCFDVIIVDSTDPQGPGAVLFSREFYEGARKCLRQGGVMVTQNGVPFFQPDELLGTLGIWRSLFADPYAYVAAIPTYVGGHMTMGFATDDKELRAISPATLERRFAEAKLETRYYTPDVHKAAFALPRFIRELVGKALG
ncbi:spermidine synthase [Rhizobiales bacterium GAS191]|nr:spermidine synthase [Rhizobiales bacterium GAS191]SEE56982.1 spermidine synthase [Rhizobiales bacterium GAS188]